MESPKTELRRRKKKANWWQAVLLVALGCLVVAGWAWYLRKPVWEARAELLLGHDDEAEQLLKTARNRWPQRDAWKAEITFLEARLARHRGQMRQMHQLLVAARKAGYDIEKLSREQIMAQAQLGEMRDAEKRLARLLSDPQGDEPEICYAFIQGYLQIQQYQGARRLLSGWAEDFPNDPRPIFLRGTVEMNMDLWKEAEKDYRKALEVDPNHFQSAYHLASVLLTQKHPEEAIKYFRIAARDETLRLDSLTGQGHCFRLLGKTKKAREMLKDIQKQDPDNVSAAFELARLDIDDGEYQKAFERLEPIVKADPLHTDARYQFAIVLHQIGRSEEAQEHFLAVKEIGKHLADASELAEHITTDAASADTRLEIAKTHLKYGSRREGLMWLRSVLAFAPNHSEALKELEQYYRTRFRENPENERFRELAEQYQQRLLATQNAP